MSNNRIVISGISGVYPKCNNIAELSDKLFAKEDLITDFPNINYSAGKLNTVSKFDSDFFEITREHAEYMDPMSRILLEKTYEAIVDAGYNPQELRNSNTAVFIANCTSDAEVESTFRTDVKGALICERAQSFLANRISYCFNLTGPSSTVNTACSSSLYALDFACKAIRNDGCEAAIVGGSNLSLAPGMVRLYRNLGITSSRCRSFDDSANGFSRSEAISVILLQKESNGRRIYAQVVHVKTNNDGYKKQSILFPSHRMQTDLINQVYQESDVPKQKVVWVEAHGTGTRVGDYQEMKSLETLCENRDKPLLAGCVKSCLGHTEAASGLCSIAKVIIAMEHKRIPPNLNFIKPQNGIDALREDKIRIITEITPWNGGYVAINNFGIGGANAHLLLKSNVKENNSIPKFTIPILVTVSGRTAAATEVITSYLKNNSINIEFIALLHKVFAISIPHHDYRAFVILDDGRSVCQKQHMQNVQRPVWFIYPGMGSQWPAMAKELLQIEICKTSILKSHNILLKRDINLLDILTNENPELQRNVLNCFVGITAIMIALTDLLAALNVEPQGLIGHSFGEIGCAYADKCLNREEALLVAYYRGVTSQQNSTIKGLMAVTGLSGQLMKERCPHTIEVVCYNGANSCTIAGPADTITEFVELLKSENIFAVIIFSSNIAYHSSYIKSLGLIYRSYLQKHVIKTNKKRSPKWISSSNNSENYCSPEYFENNLVRPVHFETALKHIPNNAITVELAPSSILKYILNDTLNPTVSNICLMNKNNLHIINDVLASLGRLFNEGVSMDISRIYPIVPFPVCRGTPMISPLIKWNHETDWYVPFANFDPQTPLESKCNQVVINCEDDEQYGFMKDHVINGHNVFPRSGFLKIIWDVAIQKNKSFLSNNLLIFEDVHFHLETEIPLKGILVFEVISTRETGYFEIIQEETVIVSGYIKSSNEQKSLTDETSLKHDTSNLTINTETIYKELQIKGYNYGKSFRTLLKSNVEVTAGVIQWTHNWTTYLDGFLQFIYLNNSDFGTITHISSLSIREDFDQFAGIIDEFSIHLKSTSDLSLHSRGVDIRGIKICEIARNHSQKPYLQSIEFNPYFGTNILSSAEMVQILVTLILENNSTSKINIHEFMCEDENLISREIYNHLQALSFYQVDVTIHTQKRDEKILKDANTFNFNFTHLPYNQKREKNVHLIILSDSQFNSMVSTEYLNSLTDSGFILSRSQKCNVKFDQIEGLEISSQYLLDNENLILWHKISKHDSLVQVNITTESFKWIEVLQTLIKRGTSKIILHSRQKHSGVLGFYNSLQRELCGKNVRCYLILDSTSPEFDLENEFYSNQIKSDMAINVYKNKSWGCYVPFKLEPLGNVRTIEAVLPLKGENKGVWVQCGTPIHYRNTEDRLIHVHYIQYYGYADSKCNQLDSSVISFSGKDRFDNSIIALSFNFHIFNIISKDECLHWKIPDSWNLEHVVAIPILYTTALLTLVNEDFEEKGSLLIQDGYSPQGQALIVSSLYLGYTVYTIEDNGDNLNYIQKHFPKITSSFTSKNLSQIGNTKLNTIIITRLGDDTNELMDKLDGYYRIIYSSIYQNIPLNMIENLVHKGVQIQFVIPNKKLFTSRQSYLQSTFQQMIDDHKVFPIALNTKKIIATNSIDTEFSTEIMERNILQLRSQNDANKQHLIEAKPRFVCSPTNSYIIFGGLGGMGFELAGWLISRGARILILISRTGYLDGYQLRKISIWRHNGILIEILVKDIISQRGVQDLLQFANKLGQVSAIFNTTLVLQDDLFENQTENSFQRVTNPKATATILLDRLSRSLCPELQHFVVFSSIVCGYGNAGQTNYGFANSVMERICEMRRDEGLPGLAIEWAGVDDVGYMKKSGISTISSGTELQSIQSCLSTLDHFLLQGKSIVTSFVVANNRTKVHNNKSVSKFATIRKIVDNIDTQLQLNTTLKDIGLDSIAVAETKNILEQEFKIFITAKDILNIKVTELWELEKMNKFSSDFESNKYIIKLTILQELYVSLFQILSRSEEMLKLKPIIRLPSLLHNEATNELSLNKERTIFFLPSIEGFASVMQPLANNIDLQILCCQYNLQTTSIKEIVNLLLPEIEKRLICRDPFHLLGYSYGGLLAMEIAHELERKGRKGFLYMIDSSPMIVKNISDNLFKDQGFRTNNLAFVRALNCGIDLEKFENELIQQKTWHDANELTINSLPCSISYNKDYLKMILDTLHSRNDDINVYKGIPKKSLISKVFFFKPIESLFDSSPPPELFEYCSSKMQEFFIPGNHFTILKSEKLAYYVRSLCKNAEV